MFQNNCSKCPIPRFCISFTRPETSTGQKGKGKFLCFLCSQCFIWLESIWPEVMVYRNATLPPKTTWNLAQIQISLTLLSHRKLMSVGLFLYQGWVTTLQSGSSWHIPNQLFHFFLRRAVIQHWHTFKYVMFFRDSSVHMNMNVYEYFF